MGDFASVKVVKQWLYRGETREFSNRHHLDFPISTFERFETFADNICDLEKTIYDAGVEITRLDYTPDGSDAVEWSTPRTVVGTGTALTGTTGPGDSAALLRFTTDERTTKNHPIYLFNYFHAPKVDVVTDHDALVDDYVTALTAYGQAWIDGIGDGALMHSRVSPRGAQAIDCFVEPYVTHRDLPRRS